MARASRWAPSRFFLRRMVPVHLKRIDASYGPAHAAGGAIVEDLAPLVLVVAAIRHPLRSCRQQFVGRGEFVVGGDELDLMAAVDFHAGRGLED